MNTNINSLISVFLLLAAIVGYVYSIIDGEIKVALAIITSSLFVWLAFLNIVNNKTSYLPLVVTLFGLLAGISLFIDIAIEQDMWGGYHINPDSALISFVLFLLAMTPGLLLFYFRNYKPFAPLTLTPADNNPSVIEEGESEEIEVNNAEPYGLWGSEEIEMAYDPEMVAAYYEAYEENEK